MLAARMEALPEIPAEVRDANEANLQSIWALINDTITSVTANHQKLLLDERRRARDREQDLDALLVAAEGETDAAVARAEAAAEALKRSDDERVRVLAGLSSRVPVSAPAGAAGPSR